MNTKRKLSVRLKKNVTMPYGPGQWQHTDRRILVLLCTEGRAVLMEPKADGKIIDNRKELPCLNCMYCNQAYTHTTTKILFCVCTGECVYLCVYSLDRAFLPGCLHPSAASVYKQMSQDKGQGCSAPVCIQANSKGTIFLTLVYVEFAVLDRNPWGKARMCVSLPTVTTPKMTPP